MSGLDWIVAGVILLAMIGRGLYAFRSILKITPATPAEPGAKTNLLPGLIAGWVGLILVNVTFLCYAPLQAHASEYAGGVFSMAALISVCTYQLLALRGHRVLGVLAVLGQWVIIVLLTAFAAFVIWGAKEIGRLH